MIGVIMYGPPAAGKDTITSALQRLDPHYSLFRRLKVGGGRTAGYRISDAAHIADLRARGEVIWENARYGALYAVDRPGLLDALAHGVPVIHLGQVPAVTAVKSSIAGTRWLVVALRCSRKTAQERIRARGTGDDIDRMQAWDETEPLQCADVVIDTDRHEPKDSAAIIVRAVSDRFLGARSGIASGQGTERE